VPHIELVAVWDEYAEWCSSHNRPVPSSESTETISERRKWALECTERRLPLEERLESSSGSLPAFLEYVEFEKASGDVPHVKCVFERALVKHCLDVSLWMRYAEYLLDVLHDAHVAVALLQRAVRNVPWAGSIWELLLRSQNEVGLKILLSMLRSHRLLDAIVGASRRCGLG
jgi:hypothetical protein